MFHQSNGSTLNSFVRHMEYKFDASSLPGLYLMCDRGTQCLIHVQDMQCKLFFVHKHVATCYVK